MNCRTFLAGEIRALSEAVGGRGLQGSDLGIKRNIVAEEGQRGEGQGNDQAGRRHGFGEIGLKFGRDLSEALRTDLKLAHYRNERCLCFI